MPDAEQAVRKAAAEIPAEVCERLDSADNLSDEDRETIIQIARRAIEELSPETEPKPAPEQVGEEDTQPKARAELKSKSGAKPGAPVKT